MIHSLSAYQAVCDELARLKAERAWRPIKSVPRDGTIVLIGRRPTAASAPMRVAFWCDEADGLVDAHTRYPSHGFTAWRLLPDGPE